MLNKSLGAKALVYNAFVKLTWIICTLLSYLATNTSFGLNSTRQQIRKPQASAYGSLYEQNREFWSSNGSSRRRPSVICQQGYS